MMMDTIAEEHSLRVSLKLLIFFSGTVSLIVLNNIFKYLTNSKIILAILYPDDVTAIFSRFAEMIHILLLLKRKFIPTRDLISHYLEVSKFINQILKI